MPYKDLVDFLNNNSSYNDHWEKKYEQIYNSVEREFNEKFHNLIKLKHEIAYLENKIDKYYDIVDLIYGEKRKTENTSD
ncbi:MAG: hypothetical protein JXQ65_03475 [Candidatus Marinimicrobia bacterium]|nr:hypothetical protein [Candidatus Neomarinimicrobiota bacterium]